MNTRRLISMAIMILLCSFNPVWGARLIQDQEPANASQKEQTDRPPYISDSERIEPATDSKDKKMPPVVKPEQPKRDYRTPPGKTVRKKTQRPAPTRTKAVRSKKANNAKNKLEVTDDGSQQVTMDFDGVDIKVFIKFIADLTGENFIMGSKVSGKVTVISPKKMTIDEAYQVFLSVLEINGYSTVKVGAITKIVKTTDAITKNLDTLLEAAPSQEDRIVTQIIPLDNANSNDMKTLLSPLLSKGTSQMLSYPQSNVLILTDTQYNIKKIQDILKVLDASGLAPEMKIVPLTYASATDLGAKINEILSEDKVEQVKRMRNIRKAGTVAESASKKIIPYERTNSLILLASPQEMSDLLALIKQLDIPTPSGKEDIHVYYLQYANAADLAKVLTNVPTPESPEAAVKGKTPASRTRTSSSSHTQDVKIMSDEETNSLIIYADPHAYSSIMETIKYLDIPRKQVFVKALIMEVKTEKNFKVGVEWTYFEDFQYDNDKRTGGILGRTGQDFVSPTSLPSGALLGVVGEAITINQGGTELTFPNISSFINAMTTDSDVNIISTPQIITMDNKEAEIKVGANVPYVTKEDTDTTNIDRTIRTFDYRDVGVTLKLTPQISQMGTIRLDVFQEITTLVPGQGEAQYAPTTLKRSADTTVTVQDGYTMVIGGLIGETLTLGDSKVPLLGDIPILGYLFKSLSKNREKTNLYIFLTPYIIDSNDKIEKLYRQKYEEMKELNGKNIQEMHIKENIYENPKP